MSVRYKDSFISTAIITIIGFGAYFLILGNDSFTFFIFAATAFYIIDVVFFVAAIAAIAMMPKGKFIYSYTYNFLATFNLLSGLAGLLLINGPANLFTLLIVANLFIGLVMYNDILRKEKTT